MKRLALLFSLVFLLAVSAFAADEKVPPRIVRAFGTADVKVVPDRAVIDIGISKQSARAAAAKQAADAVARQVLASLRELGIEEKDVQTTYLSLQPEIDYRVGMKITRFTAEQTLAITVRDLSKLDLLLEALVKAGINRMDSIRYETSEVRKYRDEARELAVKAAREKAQAMAKALGQEIGKAYSIEEVPEQSYAYSAGLMSNSTLERTRAYAPSGPATAPGERKVSASVVVVFDLN